MASVWPRDGVRSVTLITSDEAAESHVCPRLAVNSPRRHVYLGLKGKY